MLPLGISVQGISVFDLIPSGGKMLKGEQLYVCPSCKATKTFKAPTHMSWARFMSELPEKVICGYRGCPDYAVPKE